MNGLLSELAVVVITALALINAAYVAAVILDFFSLVDIVWSYAFALVAGVCLLAGDATPRFVLFAGMVGAWSLRLGTHLLLRQAAHFPREDARYGKLRESWASRLRVSFFAFFQMQALSFIILGLPLALVAADADRPLGAAEIAAFLLWAAAMAGEALADAQLKRFKSDPSRRGAVCDAGLWRFSRHPNYFFEWLVWCAYALYASRSPYGFLALLAPAVMFWLLVFATGVPPSEEQSLRSRGDLYRDYQRRTSPFVPWFPKKTSPSGGAHAR